MPMTVLALAAQRFSIESTSLKPTVPRGYYVFGNT